MTSVLLIFGASLQTEMETLSEIFPSIPQKDLAVALEEHGMNVAVDMFLTKNREGEHTQEEVSKVK